MSRERICDAHSRAEMSCFEPLESRLLLSGNVMASVSVGNLYLFGDFDANDVVVTNPSPGTFRVASGTSATTINGGAGPVDLAGVTGDITAFMDAGNDRLQINNCTCPGSVWIFGGLGNNEFDMSGGSVAGFAGVNVFNFIGDDSTSISGTNITHGIYIDNSTGTNNNAFTNVTTGWGLTVLSAFGDDSTNIAGSSIGGSVYMSNGFGAADTTLSNTSVGGFFYLYNFGGGDLNPDPGFATATSFTNTTITGPVTLLNFLGVDKATFNGGSVGSYVYINNGVDASELTMTNTPVGNSLIFIGGIAGTLPDVTGYATNVSLSGGSVGGGQFGGDVILLNSIGADWLTVNNATLHGNLTVLNSLGGARTTIEGTTHVMGAFFASNGGETNLPASGASTVITIDPSTIDGDVTIYNGPLNDILIVDQATFGGNVTVNNFDGAFNGNVTNSTFQKSLTLNSGNGASANVSLGTDSITNALSISTGNALDNVTLRAVTVTGTTSMDTGAGSDTVAIDDSSFTGAVGITTGPAVALGADADTVNIEQLAATTAITTFSSKLTIVTGADNDSVVIGRNKIASPDLFGRVHFVVGGSMDGGLGSDSLDYLLEGNIFDGAGTITTTSVENIT